MSEETDARAQCAAQELQLLARQFLAVNGLTPNTVIRLQEMVRDETRRFRQEGIDFPRLALLALPKQQAVKFYRRDLDEKGIKNVIVELTREFPEITSQEIAAAIMSAYPEYARKILH